MIGDGTGWMDRPVQIERSLWLAVVFALLGDRFPLCYLAGVICLCWWVAGVLTSTIRGPRNGSSHVPPVGPDS